MKFEFCSYRVIFFILSLFGTQYLEASEPIHTLSKNEGYLLVGVDSDTDLHQIRISGKRKFNISPELLDRGVNYKLMVMAAGNYTVFSIKPNERYQFRLSKDELNFTVRPGAINYGGHLNYRGFGGGSSAHIELINRSSVVAEYLEKNYPKLLTEIPVVYTGIGQDSFFQEVFKFSHMKGEEG